MKVAPRSAILSETCPSDLSRTGSGSPQRSGTEQGRGGARAAAERQKPVRGAAQPRRGGDRGLHGGSPRPEALHFCSTGLQSQPRGCPWGLAACPWAACPEVAAPGAASPQGALALQAVHIVGLGVGWGRVVPEAGAGSAVTPVVFGILLQPPDVERQQFSTFHAEIQSPVLSGARPRLVPVRSKCTARPGRGRGDMASQGGLTRAPHLLVAALLRAARHLHGALLCPS